MYAKRPSIRKEFRTEHEYLKSLVRDKYAANTKNFNNPYKNDVYTEWSENQLKILFILFEYSGTKVDEDVVSDGKTSSSSGGTRQLLGYIRQVPFLVMIYEGITHQVLDYDFSPRLEKFGTNYIYLNISREATSDIDLLRQAGLIDMLMVTTTDSTESRAYRLSKKGANYINKVRSEFETEPKKTSIPLDQIKNDLRLILYPPNFDENNLEQYLMQPFWDSALSQFRIVNEAAKYVRVSTITTIENISYVCSPFIPAVLNTENYLISENVVLVSEQQKIEAAKEHAHSIVKARHVGSEVILNNNSNIDTREEKEQKTTVGPAVDEDEVANASIPTSPVKAVSPTKATLAKITAVSPSDKTLTSPTKSKSSASSKINCIIENNRDIAIEAVTICQDLRDDGPIRDSAEEILRANNVYILTSEWIPFGPNIMLYLNDRLGSAEQTNGGILSGYLDRAVESSTLYNDYNNSSTTYLNKVYHYDESRHVNFSAHVDKGMQAGKMLEQYNDDRVQIQEFGISVQKDGTVIYGLQVDSTEDRYVENVAMDHLSRLLVDAHIDSSIIIDNVLTNHQRSLLNCLYNDNANRRPKYNVIMCAQLDPMMTASNYVDAGDYENEIKQIIGETYGKLQDHKAHRAASFSN